MIRYYGSNGAPHIYRPKWADIPHRNYVCINEQDLLNIMQDFRYGKSIISNLIQSIIVEATDRDFFIIRYIFMKYNIQIIRN